MALTPIRIDAAGGEYMETVVVTGWHKAVGERVARGDLLLTVETAKAATEIEAETDGWLAEIRVAGGEEAAVGAVLGQITDVEGEVVEERPASAPVATAAAPAAESAPAQRSVASPLARRMAAQRGVALAGITGTGPRGRIKARDVEKAARQAGPAAPMTARRAAPLVLLHGFGADRSSWHPVRALIPREIETLALDLPGHGGEGARPAASLADIAGDIADRLDALGLEEIHLAGHSLGGAVALALAASGRQIVRSLMAIAPAGLGHGVDRAFIEGLAGAESAQALAPWLDRMVADPAILPPGFAEAAFARVETQGNREALRRMARDLFPGGAPGFDLGGALARLDIPVRLVWGARDAIIPHDPALVLPGHVALHLLADVGHVPQLEAPALTARLLTETLRSAG